MDANNFKFLLKFLPLLFAGSKNRYTFALAFGNERVSGQAKMILDSIPYRQAVQRTRVEFFFNAGKVSKEQLKNNEPSKI